MAHAIPWLSDGIAGITGCHYDRPIMRICGGIVADWLINSMLPDDNELTATPPSDLLHSHVNPT